MIDWAWKRLLSRVDTLITERIVLFHEAMVQRKQIAPPPHGFGLAGRADVAAGRRQGVRVVS